MHVLGYKHWTLEPVPRCFNVGKGGPDRPYEMASCRRNHKWCAIAKRLGLRVEICATFVCDNHAHVMGEKCPADEAACVWEIEWIARENTFSTNHSHDDPIDIGCNFTKGGGGTVGRKPSLEETNKRRASLKATLSIPAVKEKQRQTAKDTQREINKRFDVHVNKSIAAKKRGADPVWRANQSAAQKKVQKEVQNRPEVQAKIGAKSKVAMITLLARRRFWAQHINGLSAHPRWQNHERIRP
jgi:hypothetical protein